MSCVQIASRELGVPIDLIYTNETGTHTIPVPLQTGGSMGTDVWGPAVLVKYGWICTFNIHKVPREVLKTEGEAFQHLPRDLANVNEWQNHVWSLLLHKFKGNTLKLRKCLRTLFFSLTTIFLCVHAFYKYPRFGPWPGTFSHDDLKAKHTLCVVARRVYKYNSVAGL